MTEIQDLLDVSKALAAQLWNTMKDNSQTNTIITNQNLITFSSPKIAMTGREKLSIFLYSVVPDRANKNILPGAVVAEKEAKQTAYTARYLITPVTGNAENDLLLLGKIIQTLSNTPFIEINNVENGNAIAIMLDALSYCELMQLWTALDEPLKLSASFTVKFGVAKPMTFSEPTLEPAAAIPSVMELYLTVFETFEQQVNDWKKRNFFQKQFVQSDFAKNTDMTVDAMRAELRDLGEKLQTNRPIKPYVEALKKLEGFYEHQLETLRGFEKVQRKRQEGIDMIAKWKNDIAALIEALDTQQK